MKAEAKAFWKWFSANNAPYLFLSEMDEEAKTDHLNTLMAHLHDYSPALFFEIGGVPDGEQELIITAEGNADHFDDVKTLVLAAPIMDNWRIIAFVPPRGSGFEISVEQHVIKADDIHFLPMENPMHPDALGVKINLPDYEEIKDCEWLRPAVFKILESILGEESFALDIQHVDLSPLPANAPEAVMLPLTQLQAFIKWRKAQQEKMVRMN